MTTRKHTAIALLSAIGLTGAIAIAHAQSQPPAPPAPPAASDQAPGPRGDYGPSPGWGMGYGMHPGMGMGMGYGMGMGRGMERMSKEDRAAFFDARIAAVRAGLKLTPDQEKLWPPVEAAVRDMAKSMGELYEKRRAAAAPKDPIEGMRRMADMQTARGEAMKKVADAAAPLYATLTPEQKARLPRLAHPGMRERAGMWMRSHGMHWGWGRDGDGPRGRGRWDDDDRPPMRRYRDER